MVKGPSILCRMHTETGTPTIRYMIRHIYMAPLCEDIAAGQESLLCQSYTSSDRGIDNLTDAYGDWDYVE